MHRNDIDANSLEGWLETAFTYTAMTDYPTPSNFLSPMPAYPIKQVLLSLFIYIYMCVCVTLHYTTLHLILC